MTNPCPFLSFLSHKDFPYRFVFIVRTILCYIKNAHYITFSFMQGEIYHCFVPLLSMWSAEKTICSYIKIMWTTKYFFHYVL
jgi:hypothetical protein